jgi:hypothetical protein
MGRSGLGKGRGGWGEGGRLTWEVSGVRRGGSGGLDGEEMAWAGSCITLRVVVSSWRCVVW